MRDIKEYTEVIDAVLEDMEDLGLYSPKKGDYVYDLALEARSWMGEREFYKFLEYSINCWGFETLEHHFDLD